MTEPLDDLRDEIVHGPEPAPEPNSHLLTRRDFIHAAGAVSASFFTRSSLAGTLRHPNQVNLPQETGLALVGTGADTLHIFTTSDSSWQLSQTVPTRAPISIVFHPSGRFVYVLNQISEFEGLPTGSLESYSLDPASMKITLIGRQPLSMSAIMPRSLAIDPTGNHIVVAVHGGGSYNLLPVMSDGKAGKVRSILKQTGSGPVIERQQSAHPHSVIFDTSGNNVISSDFGSDKINVLAATVDKNLPLGVEGRHMLTLRSCSETKPGSGPAHIALHPSGDFLYVSNELNGSLTAFGYDKRQGILTAARHHDARDLITSVDSMTFDATGKFLYIAGGAELLCCRVDRASGDIISEQSTSLGGDKAKVLSVHPKLRKVLAVTARGVLKIDYSNGSCSQKEANLIASVPGAQAFAIRYQ